MVVQLANSIYVTTNHDFLTAFFQIPTAHDITSHKDIGRENLLYCVNQFEANLVSMTDNGKIANFLLRQHCKQVGQARRFTSLLPGEYQHGPRYLHHHHLCRSGSPP